MALAPALARRVTRPEQGFFRQVGVPLFREGRISGGAAKSRRCSSMSPYMDQPQDIRHFAGPSHHPDEHAFDADDSAHEPA